MAPMNRRRADRGIPAPSSVTYYGQRADAGLIITDNTAISPNGKGYLNTPGIYTEEQEEAWKEIAKEVHAHNGKIFMQLVHTGRIGHEFNNEDGSPLVAPSIVSAREKIRVEGDKHFLSSIPEALTTDGIKKVIAQHVHAAERAIGAGFDGVEIHGAHGFLAEQFLHPQTNLRTDEYGGTIENRSRFLLEIMEGVGKAIGRHRTGIRLSPYNKINDLLPYPEEVLTHQYLTDQLNRLGILYIHLSGGSLAGVSAIPEGYIRDLRKRFNNILILAGGYTPASAEAALQKNLADLIAFGRPFIANPDFIHRIRNGHPLAVGEAAYYYEGGETGYTDYPTFSNAQ